MNFVDQLIDCGLLGRRTADLLLALDRSGWQSQSSSHTLGVPRDFYESWRPLATGLGIDYHIALAAWMYCGDAAPACLLAALALDFQAEGNLCLPLHDFRDIWVERLESRAAAYADRRPGGTDSEVASALAEIRGLRIPDPEGLGRFLRSVNGLVEIRSLSESRNATSPLILVREDSEHWLYSRSFLNLEWSLADAAAARFANGRDSPTLPITGTSRGFPDPDQSAAIEAAKSASFMILTGGPGSGKTTTAFHMIREAWKDHFARTGKSARICVCAPTGRAARRLEELIRAANANFSDSPEQFRAEVDRLSGITLHRLLGSPDNSKDKSPFSYVRALPFEIVLVDEASMVDIFLMTALLRRIEKSRLFLVGDPHQLPSVEAGAVLADLIAADSPRTRITRVLGTSHRSKGRVLDLANSILEGAPEEIFRRIPTLDPRSRTEAELTRGPLDFAFFSAWFGRSGVLDSSTPRQLLHELGPAVRGGVSAETMARYSEALLQTVILSPVRKGHWGVEGINRSVAAILGIPPTRGAYPGMPILIQRNDARLAVFNGDRGIVVESESGLNVWMSDGRVFPLGILPEWEAAWAMTIHKSQGSEFRRVVVVVPPGNAQSLSRDLLYTALTRSKGSLILLGESADMAAASARFARRRTMLVKMIGLKTG